MNMQNTWRDILGFDPVDQMLEFVQTPEPGSIRINIRSKVTSVEQGMIGDETKSFGIVILNIAANRDEFDRFRQIRILGRRVPSIVSNEFIAEIFVFGKGANPGILYFDLKAMKQL